ncbi:hypothetical protein A3224_08450 [Microbulbifer thermotolerans]|uniref:Fe2OG dioxygenase domain-containing protein n=2 Tax=Microbulbifer thermotolerans TaxID=252514 RepID=A0A143HM65_MICTH|nr:hypothetical protein A3224_08450 [Microbulbifer thermotolerans]
MAFEVCGGVMHEAAFATRAAALKASYADSYWIKLPPGKALLIPTWISPLETAVIYRNCLQELLWEQPRLRLFGKQYPIPRLHAFVADPAVIYRWSGLELRPQSWNDCLAALRSRLRAEGFQFNSVLANYYRGGEDSMGWHADDEKALGDWPVVATVSLGQERSLGFKPRAGGKRLSVLLPNGSLLLTSGAVQRHWLHGVSKSARKLGGRISLTFRAIRTGFTKN